MTDKAGRTRRQRASKQPIRTYVEGERLSLHKGSGHAYFSLPDGSGTRCRFYQGPYYESPGSRELNKRTLEVAAQFIREYRVLGGPVWSEKSAVTQAV